MYRFVEGLSCTSMGESASLIVSKKDSESLPKPCTSILYHATGYSVAEQRRNHDGLSEFII